jgi:hypothetical protein
MKTKVIILSSLIISVVSLMICCSKLNEPNVAGVDSPSFGSSLKAGSNAKPIIRFKWSGIESGPNNSCKGGDCGKCPGICIIFGWETLAAGTNLTFEQRSEGLGTGDVKLSGNNLFLEPDTYCDNGNGTVTIVDDFNIGAFASALGKNNIIIKKGTYTIHYSTDKPFGKIKFDVVVN